MSRRLTAEEKRAIADLEKLAARWPASLMLFSWSGSLVVVDTASFDPSDNVRASAAVLADITGIPNDGGDP